MRNSVRNGVGDHCKSPVMLGNLGDKNTGSLSRARFSSYYHIHVLSAKSHFRSTQGTLFLWRNEFSIHCFWPARIVVVGLTVDVYLHEFRGTSRDPHPTQRPALCHSVPLVVVPGRGLWTTFLFIAQYLTHFG